MPENNSPIDPNSSAGTTPTNTVSAGNMDSNSLLISIKFEKLGNSKKVPGGLYTIQADKTMIRASKKLLDSPELSAITKLDTEIRRYMESQAVPSFFKAGVWRVPNTLVEAVYEKLEAFSEQREVLVGKLVEAYPRLVNESEDKLDKAFNPRDYKEQEEVRDAFSFTWQFITFGVPEALRTIKKGLFEAEKAKTQALFADANRQIQDLLRTQVADMVNHMVDRLTPGEDGKAKTFQVGTITKIQDFIGTFDARNLADDAELATQVGKMRQLLNGVDPEKLREGVDMRANVLAGFADVKKALDKMIVIKPKRRIVLEDDPQPELPATDAQETASAPEMAAA